MNTSKKLAADGGKKSATWAAVAAAAVAVCDTGLLADLATGHKVAAVGAAFAIVRAIVAAFQGNTGDPTTAKFDKAAPSDG